MLGGGGGLNDGWKLSQLSEDSQDHLNQGAGALWGGAPGDTNNPIV